LNIAKTKYMSLGIDTNYLEVDNGDIITGCTEYKYLGSICTKDGRDTKNIRQRVTSTENNICTKWDMVVEGLNEKPEKGDYNSMVKSVLIYGTET